MQRTPGIYTTINTQTQRTGLPAQNHSIVFVTGDATAPAVPKPIYDTASADALCGNDSKTGRMIAAALTVSQAVGVDVVGGASESETITCQPEPSAWSNPITLNMINPNNLYEVGVFPDNDGAAVLINFDGISTPYNFFDAVNTKIAGSKDYIFEIESVSADAVRIRYASSIANPPSDDSIGMIRTFTQYGNFYYENTATDTIIVLPDAFAEPPVMIACVNGNIG